MKCERVLTMAYKTAGEAIDQQARDYAAEHHVEYAQIISISGHRGPEIGRSELLATPIRSVVPG